MRTLTFLFVGMIGSSAWAQSAGDMTDATEILKKVDAAAKAVKSTSYHAKFEGEGRQGKFNVEGTVVLMRKSDSSPEKFRIEAKAVGGDGKTQSLVIGSDGENYYLIDHDNKKVYVDMDPAVIGETGQIARVLEVRELNYPTPFSDEINAEIKELKGSAKVGDVDCYEIRVKYAGIPQEAVWRFSKTDLLPRQRDNIFPASERGPGGKNSHVVTNFVLDPTFVQDPFKLVIPEGYTKVDEFAP